MKKAQFNTILYFVLAAGGMFAQKKEIPKGFVYVPMGSFVMQPCNDSVKKTVSVQSFYMSEEIANKEHRQFVRYLQTHLQDSLYTIELKKMNRFIPRGKKENEKQGGKAYRITGRSNAEIAKGIIDTTVWDKFLADDAENKNKYAHYFTNKYFDDYPVVGVSCENAKWYCVWRSKTENDKRKEKHEFLLNDFRLPTEGEWLYVASLCDTTKPADEKLVAVNKGKRNFAGLHHVQDNVSEWTSSLPYSLDWRVEVKPADESRARIVCGGNFKDGKSWQCKGFFEKGKQTALVGFRVVMTAIDFRGDDL